MDGYDKNTRKFQCRIYFIARIDQTTLNSGSISILLMRRITNINIIYHYIECVETVHNINIVEQKLQTSIYCYIHVYVKTA